MNSGNLLMPSGNRQGYTCTVQYLTTELLSRALVPESTNYKFTKIIQPPPEVYNTVLVARESIPESERSPLYWFSFVCKIKAC